MPYSIGENFSMPDRDVDLHAQWTDEQQCFSIEAVTGTITAIVAGVTVRQNRPRLFNSRALTSVDLPDSVISVDRSVFALNDVTEISIGFDVEIFDETSFGDNGASFREYYIESGQQAGTYVFNGTDWSLV